MNNLFRLILCLIIAFPLYARSADECDDILRVVAKQIHFPSAPQPVTINWLDVESYPSIKIVGNIELRQVDDEVLAKILDRADECAEEKRPYYLEKTGYRFTPEHKDAFVQEIAAAQKPFSFIVAMLEKTKSPNGIELSCQTLSNYQPPLSRGGLLQVSTLLGKELLELKNDDFEAISKKIDQCKAVVTSQYPGVIISEKFAQNLDALKSDMPMIVDQQHLALQEKAKRDEEIQKADKRKQQEENPSTFVYILRWLEKINKTGGIIFIIIGSAGFAKLDKRFKTGRKNNELDAKWAMPVTIIGFVMLLFSGVLSSWADSLQFY